jgi:predicted metal-binding membrane protein
VICDAREFGRVRNAALSISAAAWLVLLVVHDSMGIVAHCPAPSPGTVPLSAPFAILLVTEPTASLAAGWVLMLVAMMSPVLISPVQHIRLSSFRHRRVRSTVLFLIGYAAIWMALGGVLIAIGLGVKLFAPESYLPAAGAVLIALVWQFSPIKQRCLNRCHAHTELAAFGVAADIDAFRFGVTHGIWCAGSCWALMLFPILMPGGHFVAMATVAILIFSERLGQPRPPRWSWRGPGKAIRIVVAQARIRLNAPRLGPSSHSFGA